MIKTIFATKKSMIQAWDAQGRRLAITKLVVEPNYVVGEKIAQIKTDKKIATAVADQRIVEIGYGQKKLKNNTKSLRTRFAQAGLKTGLKQIVGVRENAADGELLTVGQALDAASILTVGSIIKAQGTSKGRGFAGAVKRYGFHGGPKTHGQSDRLRATGSIGNRTTPGRVWLGKRMPGHFGVDTKTVQGLVIAHFDAQTGDLWLTGAVPGSFNSIIKITLTGKNKKNFALDKQASGLKEKEAAKVVVETEVTAPVETPVVTEEQEKVEKA
ncbi:MAG: 50S ribosomal protein L3 [Candidatus Moranbacteria bacterium]|nr:50S ribosomal protein L3 [Candidatus Moranbacteria bacterium]